MPSKYVVIQFADSHLRDTQYGYPSRGLDFSNSIRNIVDTAITQKNNGRPIVALLHAGDLLDNTRPSPAIIRFLNETHAKLVKARLTMYVISGNHDRTSPHWTDVLENDPGGYGIVCADHKLFKVPMGERDLMVYGMPFCAKDDFLARLETEVPKTGVDVLMWHGAIKEFVKFPMESALSVDELPIDRFQAILVGDIHVSQRIHKHGTEIISSGSTEVCKSDEDLQKNIVELEFTVGSRASETPILTDVKFIPIKTRKFLCYKLVTEDDVTNALDDVKANLDSNPVILIRANPALPNVTARFNVVVDRNKCILKVGSLPSVKMDSVLIDQQMLKSKPLDHLHIYIAPGTDLYELGQMMVDPDINEKDALERYCAEYIGKTIV